VKQRARLTFERMTAQALPGRRLAVARLQPTGFGVAAGICGNAANRNDALSSCAIVASSQIRRCNGDSLLTTGLLSHPQNESRCVVTESHFDAQSLRASLGALEGPITS
jgi:hypothetical protein